MSDEHRRALEAVHDQIIERFGGTDDSAELEKLEGIADIGMKLAGFLQSEVADEGSWVDTGSDGESYDCHVANGGREYHVAIFAGSTDQEDEAEDRERAEAASQWDTLCPRIIAALRAGSDADLAGEFERYVAPRGDGWLPWHGGECPVEPGTLVDVRHRNGTEHLSQPAGGGQDSYANKWAHRLCQTCGCSGTLAQDIIAYRLAPPR